MEGFSVKKLLDFSPLGFYKVIGLSIKIGMIILIILGVLWVKNLLFPAASQIKEIKVEAGGKVIINEDKRRIEFFGGLYGNQDTIGAFGGIKW